MKPLPAPEVPGNNDWERLDNAVRKVFGVSKEALLKEEERLKSLRPKRTLRKKRPQF